MAEVDKLFPCSGLIRQTTARFPTLGFNYDLLWEGVHLNGRPALVKTLTFGGYESSRRIHVMLIGLEPQPSLELWDFQEYNQKILIDLGWSVPPLILAPKTQITTQRRIRVCDLHLKSECPELDSRLLQTWEIDTGRSRLTNDEIFPNLEEALESFSQLAHALTQATPCRNLGTSKERATGL